MEAKTAMNAIEWYPVIVAVITIVLRVLPTVKLPRTWQWVPAVVIAAGGAAIAAMTDGKPWSVVLIEAIVAGLVLGPASIGLHHTLNRTVPIYKTTVPVKIVEGPIEDTVPVEEPFGSKRKYDGIRKTRPVEDDWFVDNPDGNEATKS